MAEQPNGHHQNDNASGEEAQRGQEGQQEPDNNEFDNPIRNPNRDDGARAPNLEVALPPSSTMFRELLEQAEREFSRYENRSPSPISRPGSALRGYAWLDFNNAPDRDDQEWVPPTAHTPQVNTSQGRVSRRSPNRRHAQHRRVRELRDNERANEQRRELRVSNGWEHGSDASDEASDENHANSNT